MEVIYVYDSLPPSAPTSRFSCPPGIASPGEIGGEGVAVRDGGSERQAGRESSYRRKLYQAGRGIGGS